MEHNGSQIPKLSDESSDSVSSSGIWELGEEGEAGDRVLALSSTRASATRRPWRRSEPQLTGPVRGKDKWGGRGATNADLRQTEPCHTEENA